VSEQENDPRGSLARALQGYLTPEQMDKLVNEVLAIEKRTSVEFHCKKCGHLQRQYGSVSDAKAVAVALPDLLNQAYGRPVEATVMADPIRFYRLTDMSELPEDAPRSAQERPGAAAAPEAA
jgi:hypothetical protein